MAHGLSLELAEIKVPEWRGPNSANVAVKKPKLSKKFRNQVWKRIRYSFLDGVRVENPGVTRQEFMKALNEMNGMNTPK